MDDALRSVCGGVPLRFLRFVTSFYERRVRFAREETNSLYSKPVQRREKGAARQAAKTYAPKANLKNNNSIQHFKPCLSNYAGR